MEPKLMTSEEIAEIRALEEKATPGPWAMERDDAFQSKRDTWRVVEVDAYARRRRQQCSARPSYLVTAYCGDDAAFITAARTDIPRLLATIAARDAEIERLKAHIAELNVALDEATGGAKE